MDLDGTQWVYSNYVLIFVEFECLFSPVDWNPSKTEALFIFPYTKHSQHPGVSVSCGQRHVDVDMTYSKFSVRVMVVFFFSPKESLHIKSYNVVIKQKPEAMTFHDSNIMPTIRTTGKEQTEEC